MKKTGSQKSGVRVPLTRYWQRPNYSFASCMISSKLMRIFLNELIILKRNKVSRMWADVSSAIFSPPEAVLQRLTEESAAQQARNNTHVVIGNQYKLGILHFTLRESRLRIRNHYIRFQGVAKSECGSESKLDLNFEKNALKSSTSS